jgi:hypothetical protein
MQVDDHTVMPASFPPLGRNIQPDGQLNRPAGQNQIAIMNRLTDGYRKIQ